MSNPRRLDLAIIVELLAVTAPDAVVALSGQLRAGDIFAIAKIARRYSFNRLGE